VREREREKAYVCIMTSFQNINFFIALSLLEQWQWSKENKEKVCALCYSAWQRAVDDDTGYQE